MEGNVHFLLVMFIMLQIKNIKSLLCALRSSQCGHFLVCLVLSGYERKEECVCELGRDTIKAPKLVLRLKQTLVPP